MEEEVASPAENEAVEEPKTPKFTWTIKNFSQQTNTKLYSDTFVVNGYKWRVLIYPKGNKVDHLSIYLVVADSSSLPYGWSRHAEFSLAVVNQRHNKLTIKKDTQQMFYARKSDWGFTSFMPISDLYDPSKGFLMNNTCIIQADITERNLNIKVKGKRKRNDTPSKKQTRSVEYDENLVGSRIKIWWPEDKMYYDAVIKSFNCIKKMHKVLYLDAEEELLNLKTEKWELVENLSPKTDCVKPPVSEKVSSPQSDIICVQGYKVKSNIAPILEAIFKKYGDIAAECVFKPASTRSSLLESVCEVVQRIETSDFTSIVSEMEEIESQVSALEGAKINISWLQPYLEAIHKRKEAKKNSILLMETKTNTVLVKRAAQMDLKERCAELVDAQQRFQKAERCVRVLDLVEKKLRKNILESKAEKDSWTKQPVL